MERLICIAVGYLFGLFQTGYIYGKMHGIDIRTYGSGNAGTTNVLRTLGKKAGLIVFLGDALKCVFAVLLMRLVFRSSYQETLSLLSIYTAAGVILGHNFPFYMKFKGGKGIAATGGFILAMSFPLAVVALATFALTLSLTHYVSLGSLLVYCGFVVEAIILGQNGYWHMEQSALNEMYIVAVLLAILAFWMHRENIKRLIAGNERKTYVFKKNK